MKHQEYMTKVFIGVALLVAMQPCSRSHAQSIAYTYPAGARQGSKVEVLVAGAGGLSRGSDVLISGKGVTAKILYRSGSGDFTFNSPFGSKSREIINDILRDETKLLSAGTRGRLNDAREYLRAKRRKKYDDRPVKEDEIEMPKDEEVFRAYPYAYRLESPSLSDLQLIYYEYFAFSFDRRGNNQAREILTTEIHVAPNATPGPREVRVLTPGGLSRPGIFWVSTSKEVVEVEPNERGAWDGWKRMTPALHQLPVQSIPIVFNGQIRPGDVDRFYFRARKGQRLTLDVQARSLEPFIANAVPGWFAAVVTLYDPDGEKIRVCGSYRFDQNPLMLVKTQKSGVHCVEIQDSIFRGRNDFVYRLSVGTFPLVHSFFPLGGAAGKPLTLNLRGGNLPMDTLDVDTGGEVYYEDFRTVRLLGDKLPIIRPFQYVVETLPVFYEPDRVVPEASVQKKEVDSEKILWSSVGEGAPDTVVSSGSWPAAPPSKAAAPVSLSFPAVVYGTIGHPGEVDEYQFETKPGQRIVLDIAAQRLGSALDAVLELVDPSGKIVAENDDRSDARGPNIGTQTHEADPHIESEIMMNGQYTVRVYGRMRKAGSDCFYRLRISPPQGDFRVVAVGSVVRLNGMNGSFRVRIFRSEGFNGPIQLKLATPNDGIVLANDGQIGPDETTKSISVRLTKKLEINPTLLDLVATANVDGKEVIRPVIATDDWEQAFIYHHLVPATHLYLAQRGKVPPDVAKADLKRKIEAEKRREAQKRREEEKKNAEMAEADKSKSDNTAPANAKNEKRSTKSNDKRDSAESKKTKDTKKDKDPKESKASSRSSLKNAPRGSRGDNRRQLNRRR